MKSTQKTYRTYANSLILEKHIELIAQTQFRLTFTSILLSSTQFIGVGRREDGLKPSRTRRCNWGRISKFATVCYQMGRLGNSVDPEARTPDSDPINLTFAA
jgi:hypothetical protein